MKHAKQLCIDAIVRLQLTSGLAPKKVLKKLKSSETHIKSTHKPLRTLWNDARNKDAQAINTLSLCLFSTLDNERLRETIAKGKPDIWVRKIDGSLINIVDYEQPQES